MINSVVQSSQNSVQLFENLEWLTIKEASCFLRITENALRIAVSRGKVRRRKWQNKLYFKKCELEELLETSFCKKGGAECR